MTNVPQQEDILAVAGYPYSFDYQLVDCAVSETAPIDISGYTWQGKIKTAKGTDVGDLVVSVVDDYTITVTITDTLIDDEDTDCGKYVLEGDNGSGSFQPYLYGGIKVKAL
jgi:hypothetical protein